MTDNHLNESIKNDQPVSQTQKIFDILRHYVFLFFFSGGLIALDQWTKSLVRRSLEYGEVWNPWDWLSPYARIVHWQNSGAAFGIFQNGGKIFCVLAVIVSLIIIYYFPQIPRKDWALRFAMVLQLGGAVGNMIDRIHQDYAVTDFISIGTFPVFNVADSSISVGVGILLLAIWISERQEKADQASECGGEQVSEGREEAPSGD